MIDRELLAKYAAEIGIQLDAEQLARFDRYAELLVEWNEKINLTAIVEPEEIVVKHFVDSLTLLTVAKPQQGACIIDVGTGAGFPSVPAAIARPDLKLTLLDSLNKRIVFLQALSDALGQSNDCIHSRAEEAGHTPAHREKYDLATARAVAHLRELSEYCLPFVKVGGYFVALKGGDVTEELAESGKAIAALGGKVEAAERLTLPDGSGRTVILIKKISQTSTKYPRPHAKISKNPLV